MEDRNDNKKKKGKSMNQQASVKKKPRPASSKKSKLLPQFKVILHNDTINNADTIVNRVMEITPLKKEAAIEKTMEAHNSGHALLLITHKELAELYAEQFQACTPQVTVSIEPA